LQEIFAVRFGHDRDASQPSQASLSGRLGMIAQGSMLFEAHNF
jgi:hypothetical protein